MKIVAYYRLSRKKKGKSKQETKQDAYGMKDQQSEVVRFALQNGADIVGEFKEVETGTRKRDRPELEKAISMACLHNAILVVAKLDRLARNVAFTSALMESGIEFVCCDNQYANKLTIHILAAVAENEAGAISERTKRSLKVAKENGVLLGSSRPGHWDGLEDKRREGARKGNIASIIARRALTKKKYLAIWGIVKDCLEKGKSHAEIADNLNRMGQKTVRGASFKRSTICKLVKLFETAA
jgi:DNA invertase Pin-like site-specific DNA recombinase